MPEASEPARICPYLRGRFQPEPVLHPHANNQCILAASIHLPQGQQSRYCLGGGHTRCSRFRRQQDQPLPRYVTGVHPTLPPPPSPKPDIPDLVWRRPFWRRWLRWLPILLLIALMALGWRWRQSTLPVHTDAGRPPLPTPIAAPTTAPNIEFLRPTYGPPALP